MTGNDRLRESLRNIGKGGRGRGRAAPGAGPLEGEILEHLGDLRRRLELLEFLIIGRVLLAMDRRLSLDELQLLCQAVGADWDSLPGRTKSGRIRELIIWCHERNRVGELIQEFKKMRPGAEL